MQHYLVEFSSSLFNICGLIANQYSVKFGADYINGPHIRFLACDEYATQNKGNAQIELKDNVWVGGHSTICGGVTIGKNSVIGAYSVVTEDIPDNVIAFGAPCKVFREIKEEDRFDFGEPTKEEDILALGNSFFQCSNNYIPLALKARDFSEKHGKDGFLFTPVLSEDFSVVFNNEYLFRDGLAKNPTDIEKRSQLLANFILKGGHNNQFPDDFWILATCRVCIGDNNVFGHNVTILADAMTTIKNNTKIGDDCCFVSGFHPIDVLRRTNGILFSKPITIEDNVTLEDGVFVYGGVTIGKNSIIGKNSFVTKDIPENVYAEGVPCRVIRKL